MVPVLVLVLYPGRCAATRSHVIKHDTALPYLVAFSYITPQLVLISGYEYIL